MFLRKTKIKNRETKNNMDIQADFSITELITRLQIIKYGTFD
jgi:hypothetical protein